MSSLPRPSNRLETKNPFRSLGLAVNPKSSAPELMGFRMFWACSQSEPPPLLRKISKPPMPGCPSDAKNKTVSDAWIKGNISSLSVLMVAPRFTGSSQVSSWVRFINQISRPPKPPSALLATKYNLSSLTEIEG